MATDLLTRPDTDIEELLDASIPCCGANCPDDGCPNEVAWRISLSCCGRTIFLCQSCYGVVEVALRLYWTGTDGGGCGQIMDLDTMLARRVRI